MRFCLIITFFLNVLNATAQQESLAKQYFNDGNFEKATLYYETLYKDNPLRMDYLKYLLACYQQLERYDAVEKIVFQNLKTPYGHPFFYIELGYNYALQNKEKEAQDYYEAAIEKITEEPSSAYRIGNAFKEKSLLVYALKAFQKGITHHPGPDLYYNIAAIHGEMGNIEAMYTTYLELLVYENDQVVKMVKRKLADFITENPKTTNNILLKRILLGKIQKKPRLIWNEMLSWLFVQQRQFQHAFIQEKAIYKRSEEPSLQRIVELGALASEERYPIIASDIFTFVLEHTQNHSLKLEMHVYLIQTAMAAELSEKEQQRIEKKFETLFNEYGYVAATLPLQLLYARFLVFQQSNSKKAIALLKTALTLPLRSFDEANIKMTLADILVYEEHFNQALIYYAQVQKSMKNNILAQTARFKTAQTSFYKGDFKWAQVQLGVLKSSTSQFIANDALQWKLLITDHVHEETTQTALKQYAKALLLAYQQKTAQAIALLEDILILHKGEMIEDETLLKQGQLLEKKQAYQQAASNYLKIITFHSDGILIDDALFALAKLFEDVLDMPEKAKNYYEKLILEHQDSVYVVAARKRYRILREDVLH